MKEIKETNDRVRYFLGSRFLRISMLCFVVLSVLCMSASASDETASATSSTVISAFQTGFQQIASDAMQIISIAAPIALGIAAVVFITRKAMSWFKSMAK